MTPVLLVVIAVLGLLVGSFLNVVVYRVPRGESLVRPASQCPACGHPIRAWHNVPVLGWLVLRGKCYDCGNPISVRYPLVELGTGVLFLALAVQLNHLGLARAIPPYLYFAAIGVALALVDLDHHRLPNAIVLPSYPVLAVLLAASSAWQHDWWPLARAAIGAACLLAFFFAVAFIYPAGMGMGDVKLSGIIGGVLAYLSWSTMVIGAFLGFLLGAVIGVALIAAKHGNRKTAVPFGPFMIAGAILAMFVAGPLMDAYRSLLP